MTSSTIWLSFDLGIRGDYEGLYSWLAGYKAKECTDSVAVLNYRYSGSLIDYLKEDIKKNVNIDKRTRIYVIYREITSNKNKGNFLFGGWRTPAWASYDLAEVGAIDDEV